MTDEDKLKVIEDLNNYFEISKLYINQIDYYYNVFYYDQINYTEFKKMYKKSKDEFKRNLSNKLNNKEIVLMF